MALATLQTLGVVVALKLIPLRIDCGTDINLEPPGVLTYLLFDLLWLKLCARQIKKLFQPNFIVGVYQLQDGFISHPRPTNPINLRILAGLRDYSPIASLLDSRLLQPTECLSLIRLANIIQRLKALLYKDLMSKLYSLTAPLGAS